MNFPVEPAAAGRRGACYTIFVLTDAVARARLKPASMDLRTVLLDLMHPTRCGESLANDLVFVDASVELGLRLVFESAGRDVVVEVDSAAEGRRAAARSEHFTFAYRNGDRMAPIDPQFGRKVCEIVAARARENEAELIAKLRSDLADAPSSGTRIREIRGERLLDRAGTPDERYYTLNPYAGCLIGCRFCYAPSRLDPLRRLAGLPPTPWGSWVDVRADAPEVLARELTSLPPWPIKICPIVSDPYHAIEARFRITRRCLEVLRDAQREVLVLTRSASIVEDVEILAANRNAWAGVSLPTADDEIRRHFEPRAASVDERLAALETLRRAGVRTFAIVQPILPGSIEGLADQLASRVTSVRIDVLQGTYAAADDFARYPHIVDPAWQRAQADTLATALRARGVAVWPGELPPAEVR